MGFRCSSEYQPGTASFRIGWKLPSCPSPEGWTPGSSRSRRRGRIRKPSLAPLMSSSSPPEIARTSSRRFDTRVSERDPRHPPSRFLPLQRLPSTGQRPRGTGLPHPNRLRLQVFSTSWRLHPPRACWPCLMPVPLLGFTLQSFAPLAQPYAVPSAVPLVTLGPPAATPRPSPDDHRNHLGCAAATRAQPDVRPARPPLPPGSCSTRESAARHGCLDRDGHVALLGLFPSRAFTLAGMSTAFTAPPLMRLARRA
jgi:hypothetical protein